MDPTIAEIRRRLIQEGFLDGNTGQLRSLLGIYHAAQNYGVTGAQLDEATGQPAGTTDNYIKSQGWAPLSGKDTNEALDANTLGMSDTDLQKLMTSSGLYNPQTKEVDARSVKQITDRYGLDNNLYNSILTRAGHFGSNSGSGTGGETDTGDQIDNTDVDDGTTVVNPSPGGIGSLNPVTNYTNTTGIGSGVSAPDVDPMSSNLSPVFGPYTMGMLGKAQALGELPYQPFEGQRFAEYDPLQQKAFSGIGALDPFSLYKQSGELGTSAQKTLQELQGAGYDISDPNVVKKFMNPFTQNVTDIQKREMQRSFDVQQAGRDAAAYKAGAFGGARHGIVEAEAERNLNQQMEDAQFRGDKAAYDAAVDALLKQRASKTQEANSMLGSAQGLGTLANTQLNAMLNAGQFKQNTAQKPLDFGYQQFQESLAYPWQQVTNMKTALNGLPISVTPTPGTTTNPLNDAISGGLGAWSLYKQLFPNGFNFGGSGGSSGIDLTSGTPFSTNLNGGLGSIDTSSNVNIGNTGGFIGGNDSSGWDLSGWGT